MGERISSFAIYKTHRENIKANGTILTPSSQNGTLIITNVHFAKENVSGRQIGYNIDGIV